MDEKLLFRRALTSDAARILEIIRQAQAQMRALGSQQWQDGYPAAADIGRDIACGYGWVLEKPGTAKGVKTGDSNGAEATGCHSATDTIRVTTTSRAAGTAEMPGERPDGMAGTTCKRADGTAKTTGNRTPGTAEILNSDGTTEIPGKPEDPRASAKAEAQGSVIAYGAVVFDGEPAYEAIEGAWHTGGDYVVLHRMAVADGEKGRGVATEFMRRVEAMARGRGSASFRVDTNFDNRYMLRMLGRLGFVYCGKVRYRSGERLAFEKPFGA